MVSKYSVKIIIIYYMFLQVGLSSNWVHVGSGEKKYFLM
jgi:hypothetical protein